MNFEVGNAKKGTGGIKAKKKSKKCFAIFYMNHELELAKKGTCGVYQKFLIYPKFFQF